MKTFNVHEAKTHLSRLLRRVARGEELVIARDGEPVARLVPFLRPGREPGRFRGRIVVEGDFDAPLPADQARRFRGETD